jgi:hypothetical protein
MGIEEIRGFAQHPAGFDFVPLPDSFCVASGLLKVWPCHQNSLWRVVSANSQNTHYST